MATLFKMVCHFCFLTKKGFASQLLITLRRKTASNTASKAASNTAVLNTFLDL